MRSLSAFILVWCLAANPNSASAAGAARASRDDATYRQLELFARVLSYVENNYVEPVDDQKLMYGAIKGMLDTLDPHTAFMPPDVFREMKIDTSGEFGGIGLELTKREGVVTVVAAMEDTPAARAGIVAGDQVLRIDASELAPLELNEAISKLRGPAGQRVVLTIMRKGFAAPRDLTVIRDHIRIISVEGALYGGIAHVRLRNFQERTDLYLAKELSRLRKENGNAPLRAVVLDLRNNPGGLLDQAVAVSDRFLPGGLPIVSTRGRNGRNTSVETSKERDTEPAYPMVVLVNAGSASASEIVAGALHDHGRAVLMGSPTFGKGSVQTVIELEDGSGLKLTIARYYTPRGRSIQERGIAPDFVIADDAATNVVRERDLNRHIKNESSAERAAAAKALPSNLPPWGVTAQLTDAPLKVALDYLNGEVLAAKPKSVAAGTP